MSPVRAVVVFDVVKGWPRLDLQCRVSAEELRLGLRKRDVGRARGLDDQRLCGGGLKALPGRFFSDGDP